MHGRPGVAMLVVGALVLLVLSFVLLWPYLP
jgi:hypothetical protein